MGLPNPPRLDDWQIRKDSVASYQQEWRQESEVAESLYEQTWTMDGIPDGVPVTVPSTARAIVDEATDHSDFDPKFMRVHTPTYGLTEAAAEKSSRIRAFFPGWLTYQVAYANDVSPIRDYTKNMHIYGKAVYKVFYDKAEWPLLDVSDGSTEDDLRKAEDRVARDREFIVPITLRSIHPTALYEDPSLGQKRWAIEVYDHAAIEVHGLYEHWTPAVLTEEQLLDPEVRVEIWDCYQIGRQDDVSGIWHQVLISEGEAGEGAISEATPAVFLPNEPFPYIIKFSGYGRQSGGKYEEKARGLLYGVKSLLRAEGRRLTQLDSIISAMAWPTLFVTGPRTRFRVAYGPNIVNYIPSNVNVQTVVPPIPAGPIQSALAVLQSGIERGTFGSVIRGDKPPQTTSAAQLAILSGQARLRFGSIHIHHEAAMIEVCRKVSQIVRDVIKEPITLWQWDDTDAQTPAQLVLRPSDLPEQLAVHLEIMTDPVEEQERRAQLGVFLWEKGAIDWEDMAERAGVKDVKAMRRRIIRDKILFESPAVIQALGERYLLESGYDIESLTLEKTIRDLLILRTQSQAQQAIIGQPGGATTPGNEPQASQGFSPNQLGGRPAVVPTPAVAQQRGEASAAG